MDRLEEFIRTNRDELDRYIPPQSVWKRISKNLKRRRLPLILWSSVAAMFIVILGSAIFFYRSNSVEKDILNNALNDNDLNITNYQLKESEIYYNNLANTLYQEATPLLIGNPEIKEELNTDISQLDSICADIKKDLKDNVANSEVVEALIQNYRIKIRLLEDMLTILKENENNTEKTKNYEL